MKYILHLILFVLILQPIGAQEIITNQAEFEANYQKRIKKEMINGVYIPIDLEDAFYELERLTDVDMINKFQSAPEDTVARKLHFSLGRWITRNWGFYEGSRMSHFLKEKGLAFPDDMAQCIIVSWHRKLNEKEIDLPGQIMVYQEKRRIEAEEREQRKEVISVERRKRKKE